MGGCVGFAVSFLLLPSRAHAQVGEAAARTLGQIARVLGALLSDVVEGIGTDELHRLQDGIGRSLVELSTIAAEAQHERSARLTFKPDTGPLLRTLLRLRHDLVLIGRTAQLPLPEPLKSRLRVDRYPRGRRRRRLFKRLRGRAQDAAPAATAARPCRRVRLLPCRAWRHPRARPDAGAERRGSRALLCTWICPGAAAAKLQGPRALCHRMGRRFEPVGQGRRSAVFVQRVPYARSPASPRPGKM